VVAHRHCFGLQLATPRNGHDHLPDVLGAVAAAAALAVQDQGLQTFRLAATLRLIQYLRCGFELQVPLDIGLQPLAAILNTDFLSVVVNASVPSAEAAGAVLALAQQRFATSAESGPMVAVSGLVILADFHASSPGYTSVARQSGRGAPKSG